MSMVVVETYWIAQKGNHTISIIVGETFPIEWNVWNNYAETNIVVSDYIVETPVPEKLPPPVYPPDDIPIAPVAVGATSTLAALFLAFRENARWLVLKVPLIPLYSRITNGQVLQQKRRNDIYEYIQENPGASFSDIMKVFDLKNGVASYHLTKLEKEGYIKSKRDKVYRRFYPMGMDVGGVSTSQFQDRILETIEKSPGISQSDLSTLFGVSNQVINYHIKFLARENMLEVTKDGTKTKCFVTS